jgi:predicted ATPase
MGKSALLAYAAAPIVCLVDDAQWLDAPSADALAFVARRLVAERIVIVFGAREGELRRFGGPGLDDLTLTGLGPAAALELLRRSAPEVPAAVRERLLAAADGNPLALLELPAGLSERQLAGSSSLPEALPLTARLRAIFSDRVARLPGPTRSALLIAAAQDAGDLGLTLRAATGLRLGPDALDPAQESGLIHTEAGTIAFRHPLVRSAVYASAPPGARRRIHAALADVLEADGRADRALWHRAMSADAPDETTADALEDSTRRSRLRGGHASAA